MTKNRYQKVNGRLNTVVAELREIGTEAGNEFDHMEWLMCEREALIMERERIETVMSAEGEVHY